MILPKVKPSGSPPQVRGKRLRVCPTAAQDGITPAGAGKTLHLVSPFRRSGDHPRRCGENPTFVPAVVEIIGSPPQVRGKPQEKAWNPAYGRITPAGAGKTCPCGSSGRHAVDHPRRCGENSAVGNIADLSVGSPPQVRGKLDIVVVRRLTARITPAGAGKTR